MVVLNILLGSFIRDHLLTERAYLRGKFSADIENRTEAFELLQTLQPSATSVFERNIVSFLEAHLSAFAAGSNAPSATDIAVQPGYAEYDESMLASAFPVPELFDTLMVS